MVHLNTYDIAGGAAQATHRLHTGLGRLGYDSSMFVAYKSSDDPTVMQVISTMDIATRVRRRMRYVKITRGFVRYRSTRPAGYELFSDDRTVYAADVARSLPSCDVINLHWIAGFVDYQSFFWTYPNSFRSFGGCRRDAELLLSGGSMIPVFGRYAVEIRG